MPTLCKSQEETGMQFGCAILEMARTNGHGLNYFLSDEVFKNWWVRCVNLSKSVSWEYISFIEFSLKWLDYIS